MFLEAVKALRTVLKAQAELNTAVDGQWFLDLAQEGFSYPYGVLALNAGGMDNSAALRRSDLRMLVQVIGTNQTRTHELGELVRQTLHEGTLTADDPWTIWRCQQISSIHQMEIEAQVAYWYAGGIYRIRMSGS
jgi:hypothetical protein